MTESNDYREGNMADPTPKPTAEQVKLERPGIDFTPKSNVPPTGEEPEGSAYTAVLLIQRHDGIVIPIVQGLNVSVHREATPHDILRMCADVKDQVAQTRGTGETLRHTRMMLSGLFPEAADAANARFEAAMKEREARAEVARAQAEQASAYSESTGDE